MIGALGDVTFEVSLQKVFTFNDLKFNHAANYTEHAVHNKKGILEFTGLKASTASFSMILDAHIGVNPEEELDRLHEMLEQHTVVPWILDGKLQGWSRWVIEGLDETHKVLDNTGRLIQAEVTVKLREYLREIE